MDLVTDSVDTAGDMSPAFGGLDSNVTVKVSYNQGVKLLFKLLFYHICPSGYFN